MITAAVCPREDQLDRTNKNTSYVREENMRKVEMIDTLNKENNFTWVAGRTTFLSSTCSEAQAYRTGEIPPCRADMRQSPEANKARTEFLASLESNRIEREYLPSTMEVFSTDAKDQGECNSCAAFAVTAALETCEQKVINFPAFMTDPPRGLSTQNLLDCAFGGPGLHGCDGGQSFRYLQWMKNGTLDKERQYPYIDSGIRFEGMSNDYRVCYQTVTEPVAVVEEGYSSWDDHTERDLENILLDGNAIITTMEAQEDFLFYKSGVYQSSQCQEWSLGPGREIQWEASSGLRPLRHTVVIMGFGEEQGKKYWKVKNSWGENWGSSGFFKMIRNGSAHCGLGAYFSVALCKTCGQGDDCKARGLGLPQPSSRPPPRLPDEGIGSGITSHLASALGGVGFATCPTCAGLSACPTLQACRREGKCCRVIGGAGNRLYCPSRC